ncbi:Protein scd2/ral3 [Cyberlindnera fabianii]|uniref:Protein scd2/ral3 n=1 Tax=Cyberlindnera fabianii TaxID=36022 RepID=A0A1V2LDF3_CYBFA|nr:Protein scd2/ral3 [Cyberlindnera fabianii]
MLRLTRSKSIKDLKISAPLSPPPPLPTPDKFEEFSQPHQPARIASMVSSSSNNSNSSSSNVPRSNPHNSVILITKFDFKAENRHELSVGVGEALKLIERKGNGWILVKPIGRISDPGLIPASYVKIVRMSKERPNSKSDEKWLSQSDSPVPELPSHLMNVGKKPSLTGVGSQDSPTMVGRAASTSSSANSSLMSSPRERDNTKYSSVDTSSYAECSGSGTCQDNTYFTFQAPYDVSLPPSPSSPVSMSHHAVPISGLVRNANSFNGRYWYRVDITMSDGKKRYLCRYYQDFYKLHCTIIEQLIANVKHGEDEQDLIDQLPALPDPIARPDLTTLSNILLQRCQGLNVYIFKIVRNKPELNYGNVLTDWVKPRLGDLELGPDTQLSNDSIEALLKPISANVNKSSLKTQLTIQTSVTPPLPAPEAPKYYHPSARSASTSSIASFQSSPNSPKVWQSPTMAQSPVFRNERSLSTTTIPEGKEVQQDWMTTPTEPLTIGKPKKRNVSCSSLSEVPENQTVKVKIYYNDDIFALKFEKEHTGILDVKKSIAKRLECEIDALRLYYKNPVKNYFSPLVDDTDVTSAFEMLKASVKVHIWDNKI